MLRKLSATFRRHCGSKEQPYRWPHSLWRARTPKKSAGNPNRRHQRHDVTVVPLRAAFLEPGKSAPPISFRDNLERAESLARAASATVKRAIDELKSKRLNEPEWQSEIDFLSLVSSTLDQIADAISDARRATTPEDREPKLIQAETLAGGLAKACRDFAERNYERVINYAGYSAFTILGTLLFTQLFPLSAQEALAAQLVLLGLSGGPKK